MADQRRWFKVWTSIVANGVFAEMSLEDIGRWTLLGAATALDGDRGMLQVPGEGKELCRLLRVPDLEAAKEALKRLRSVEFEEGQNRNDAGTVTWRNWRKYQEDTTGRERQQTSRSKRRGEERRREEKKTTTASHAQQEASESNGFSTWPPEWDPLKAKIEALPFLKQHAAWLDDLQWWITLDEWLTSAPKPLDELLTDAVAHIVSSGYVPRTKQALRSKIKNCLHVAGRIAEREAQREKPASY